MTGRLSLVVLIGIASAALGSCSLLIKTDDCVADADCDAGSSCDVAVGSCRDLRSGPDCTELVGAWEDEGAILIGFVAPLSGENTESGLYLRRAVELAVEEINGVGGVGGGQGGRPLAVLLCDDQNDQQTREL